VEVADADAEAEVEAEVDVDPALPAPLARIFALYPPCAWRLLLVALFVPMLNSLDANGWRRLNGRQKQIA